MLYSVRLQMIAWNVLMSICCYLVTNATIGRDADMLKSPKPGFEEVIKLHFKHRKVPLLKTLHGWVEEVPHLAGVTLHALTLYYHTFAASYMVPVLWHAVAVLLVCRSEGTYNIYRKCRQRRSPGARTTREICGSL